MAEGVAAGVGKGPLARMAEGRVPQIVAQRDAGCAVLLISADFDEVLKLSDRIVVLFEGQIMGTYSGANPPIKEISLAMAGK